MHGHGSNSSHRQRLAGRTSRTCRLQDLRAASSTGTWPRELQAILRADPVDDIAKRTARPRWGITDDHLHIHMDPVVGLPTRYLIAQRKCSWFVIFLNAVYRNADVTALMCRTVTRESCLSGEGVIMTIPKSETNVNCKHIHILSLWYAKKKYTSTML